jgi:hypothetical protein
MLVQPQLTTVVAVRVVTTGVVPAAMPVHQVPLVVAVAVVAPVLSFVPQLP